MITKIMGEAPFQVLTNNFSISPSNEGYTLQISADGKNYSNLFQVGANVTRLVTGVAANSYYRLLGNNSEVSINWMKTCVTEGGGSGSGVTPEEVQAQIDSALTVYTPTANFATINGSAITSGGNITIEGVSQEDFNFISGRVQTNEEVVSEALNDLNNRIEEISGNTGGSTEDIELPIAAAINEVRDTFNAKLSQQYYKKQEVNDIAARKMEAGQVNEQIVSYVDPLIEEVNDTIEDKELPVSAAINELNEKKVEGINVKAIWSGSQSDYDTIVTKDPDTLYIIK